MREIRAAIEEKKKAGLLTDEEIREVASRPLRPVLQPHDLKSGLLAELLERPSRWNFEFETEAIYRSSRGGAGRVLEGIRRALRPVQKLFWNPTPMIAALSRQKDVNTAYAHLLHNLVLEVTRLNLEIVDLKNRSLQLQSRLELLARREKTLESMALGPPPAPRGPAHPRPPRAGRVRPAHGGGAGQQRVNPPRARGRRLRAHGRAAHRHGPGLLPRRDGTRGPPALRRRAHERGLRRPHHP